MRARPLLLLPIALVLTACAVSPPQEAALPATGAEGDGHGDVAGAVETSEPQLALTTVDAAGALRQLDLLDGSVEELARVRIPERVETDGRYVFADDGNGVSIVDSGRWTWDHVDHLHYYRAEPRLLGTVPGRGAAAVATTNSSTAGGIGVFFAESGEAVLLDAEALSEGEVIELFRVGTTPHAGLVVPVGSSALVTEVDGPAGHVVRGYGSDGRPMPDVAMACPDPAGTITTRVGAVIGCADGAVLATSADGRLALEKIPYPDDSPAPAATRFDNREGRPTVAALAGEAGIWVLDTRERRWTLLPAPEPLQQVTAVDDEDETLLALSAEGRVLVIDGAAGTVRAATGPLLPDTLRDPWLLAGVRLVADVQRAYLNAPAEHRLYEIDYADAARVARTFETESAPLFLAEVGR